jgi:hypothetical protein
MKFSHERFEVTPKFGVKRQESVVKQTLKREVKWRLELKIGRVRYVKVNGTGVAVHAMKPCRNTGGIAPPILYLTTRLKWSGLFNAGGRTRVPD